jgi:hypothetical protein
MVDPLIFLPSGAFVKSARGGYSAIKSAALVGAAGGFQTGIQESILQATQETRTAAESAMAIGSATLLTGLFGTGAAAFASRVERKALERA